MSRVIDSEAHEALRRFLIEKRKAAGINQADLGKKLRRPQSYVSDVERGQRIVSVVDLLLLADALGFDPRKAIGQLQRGRR